MNVSEQIDNFINLNTKATDGIWEWRTRDALNIALARLDRAEDRAVQLEAERDEARRQLEQARKALALIEDQAGRAALVQDRSVRIIKQVCKLIAEVAREAQS